MIDKPLYVQYVTPGSNLGRVKPGDFFLISENKFSSKLIQFGQRRRFTKDEACWNHCGIFTDVAQNIAESLVKTGVTRGNISKYADQNYIIVNILASYADRLEMMRFVDWSIGQPYGMMTDVNLALWSLFGGKFDFSIDGQEICSGFVARTLERAGYIFDRDPSRETPADLARHFQVHQCLNR